MALPPDPIVISPGRARKPQQIGNSLHGQRRMSDQDVRRDADARDRREIVDRVVRQFGEQARVDAVRAARAHQESVAIGALLATSSEPTTPLAPARLSMTTGWPTLRKISGRSVRASKSDGPPAASGTMMRMAFAGYCANAGVAIQGKHARDNNDPVFACAHTPSVAAFF